MGRSIARACLGLLFLVTLAVPAYAEQELADLVAQLDDADAIKRNAAYSALLRRRDEAVVPMLERNLPLFKQSYGKYYGVMILQNLRTKSSDQALVKLSKSKDGYVRCLAGVGRFIRGDKDGIPAVVAYLTDASVSDTDLQQILGQIYSARDPRVVDALVQIVKGKRNDNILAAAMQALLYIGGEKATDSIVPFLKSERPALRHLAAAFLHRFGDHRGVSALAEAIAERSIDISTLSRVRTFLQLSPEVAPALLDAIVKSLEDNPDASHVTTWTYLLGRIGYRGAIPALRKLLESSNSSVSDAAFKALAEIPGGLEPSSLETILEDGSNKQRLQAADALRKMDDMRGLSVVIEICESSVADRYEATRVLAGFRSPKVVPVLIGLLMDDNRNVRMYASNGLQTVLTSLFPYRKIRIESAGYHYDAPGPKRQQGVNAIKSWWARTQDRPW